MQLRFDPIVAGDAALLGRFLSASDWPFHVEQSVNEDWVRGRSEYPETGRLGGFTRHDNVAMRRVLEKCGFSLEAQHRRAWRVPGASPVDAVGYAILREEAEAP
jgi:RimJ/RimL family protein N-acetyltransferase